jgi:hypothetical protein
MSKDLLRYRRLERQLWMARWRHEGKESAEEDEILDEMELVWLHLSYSEQAILRAEGPRCWPMDSLTLPPQFEDERYVAEPEAWAYEGFPSPLEAIFSTKAA